MSPSIKVDRSWSSKANSANRVRNGALVLAAVFVLAVFAYHFWGEYDWFEAVWMVVITISSVGYSESSSASASVRLISIAVIFFGMSASAYTFGGVIRMMLEGELEKAMGHRKLTRELAKLNDHIIVCGYGRMGQELCNALHAMEREFVVIETSTDRVELATKRGQLSFYGDALIDETLKSAGVDRAHSLVTVLPSDADNVFITLTARNLCPNIQIIARAERVATESKLRQAGADRVVTPAVSGARQMTRMITRPSTADLFEVVSESSSMDLELDEVFVSPNSPVVEKAFHEVEFLKDNNVMVVAIKRSDGRLEFNPQDERRFAPEETVILLGHGDEINRLRTYF